MKAWRMTGALFIAAAFLAAPSRAEWIVDIGEDPMDDVATAYIEARYASMLLSFKCWKKRADDLTIILSTPEPYNTAASYPPTADFRVRADKMKPRTITFQVQNLAGTLTFVSSFRDDWDVWGILFDMNKSSKRVAVETTTAIFPFSLGGARPALRALEETCELYLVPPE